MCAKNSGELTWAASSRRFRSFQAGSVLLNTPGVPPGAVPADTEAVAVRRLGPEPRVQALVDERVLRGEEQSSARIGDPE